MAELPNLSCARCGHNWIARRHRRPFACPRCQSTCWDEPAVALSRFRLSKRLSSKNGSPGLRIPGSFSRTPRISRSGLLNEARAPYSEHHVSKVAIVNSRYEILQRLILFSGVRLVVSAAEGWGEVQVRAFILIVLGGALF